MNTRQVIAFLNSYLPTFPRRYRLALLLLPLLLGGLYRGLTRVQAVAVDSTGNVGQYSSLLIVNGNPAISYYDVTNGDLKYVRALDVNGTTWGTPVTVDNGTNVGLWTSLQIVNGRPAISYQDLTNNDLKYVRALDADGATWGAPVTVVSTGVVGAYTSLQVINGNPAISYGDATLSSTQNKLKYVRALDADGATWGAPVTPDNGTDVGYTTTLKVINGNPAISYWDQQGTAVKYVRATEVNGATWAAAVTVYSPGFTGLDPALAEVNGAPAISFLHNDTRDLFYLRALDADGATWPATPVTVDSAGDVGFSSFLQVVNGLPAIGYLDLTGSNLKYARATDVNGATWGTPLSIAIKGDFFTLFGARTSMQLVNGKPAISFYNVSTGDLEFAREGNEPIDIVVEQPAGTVLAKGGSIPFGNIAVGNSAELVFTVRQNSAWSAGDLTGLNVTIDGVNADQFSVFAQPAGTVSPDSSTTFTVRFTPTSFGGKTAVLQLASNDPDDNPFDINLSGSTVPEIAVEQPAGTNIADGGSKSFGSVNLGGTVELVFTVKNTGAADLTGLGITIDGTNASEFSITANPTAPVMPAGSTTFTVRFAPTSVGSKTAALHIANNDPDENPFDVNLTSFGIRPPTSMNTVCASGCDYSSLTGALGVFEAINNSVLNGNLTFNISGNLTEDGTNALNQWAEAGGAHTVTIQPADGTPKTLVGNVSSGMIRLNGADRVTIDGRFDNAGRFLTFRNTHTSGATITLSNDATNNIMRNSIIEGAATSSSNGVILFSTGATIGNDNNTISENQIRDRSDATGVPNTLINSLGSSPTVANSNNTVSNNELINFTAKAIAMDADNESWTISGNTIYQTTTRTTALTAIDFNGGGTNTISQNTIRDLTTNLGVTGLTLTGAGATTIARNRIYSIPSTAGSGAGLVGISIGAISGGSVTVVNNQITLIPAFANNQAILGIRDLTSSSSGQPLNLYYNTVLIGGTSSGPASTSAFRRATTATATLTARNNIFFNNRTGASGNHYAASRQTASGTFSSDYNLFVGTGVTPANFMDFGTTTAGTPVSFATWQTSTGGDANSQAGNSGGNFTTAMFVNPSVGDLHIVAGGNPLVVYTGTPVSGLTTDFDNDTRSATRPWLGSDEPPNTAPTITAATGLTRQQGTAAGNSPIATVSDTENGAGGVSVDVASANPSNGVTVSNLVNSNGVITADIATTCDASNASFTLQVSDGEAMATATLNVAVTANTAPVLSYANQTAVAGGTLNVAPTAASDNGSIAAFALLSQGSYTGMIGVNPATGVVTLGNIKPTGTHTIIIRATDNCGVPKDASFTVTVGCQTLTVTPPAVTTATAGQPFSATFTQSGGVGAVSFSTANPLPPGLSLSSAGLLGGTPTQKGSFTFTVKVSDSNGCTGQADYTLTVGCPTLTFAPTSLRGGVQGTAYNQTFSVNPAGGGYSYAVTLGILPPGLTLDGATGLLSGMPSTGGNFSFTITATGWGACPVSRAYTLLITGTCATITVNPAALAAGTLGAAYSQTFSATGGSGPYSFAVTNGALPGGLTLNASTGGLSGTPTASGIFSFRVTATVPGGCTGSRQYVLSIGCAALSFSPASLPNGLRGAAYSQQLTVSPTGTYVFSLLLGSLPPGFTLSSAGLLSGTSTQAGTFNFTVKALTGSCQGTKAYTLVLVNGAAALAQRADYDGDGRSDFALWSAGNWQLLLSDSGASRQAQTQSWGTAGDLTLLGDYDGDGRTDLAVWRPSNGTWYVQRSSDSSALVKAWGTKGDVPVPGDYDGDGQTDLAVFRPSEGHWYVLRSSDQQAAVTAWGAGYAPYHDLAVPGDYDGDGQTDLAVFRRATGEWLVKRSRDGQFLVKQWGVAADVPVAADYDGDGLTDIAVWRTGTWYIWQSATNSQRVEAWGTSAAPASNQAALGDQAAPGDYDGDGRADVAVWRAGESTWHLCQSSDQTIRTHAHGQSADKPVPIR